MARELQVDSASVAALDERRARQRYPLDFPASVRPLEQDALARSGRTSDVSSTGLYVQCEPGPLAAGMRVEVWVRLPGNALGPAVALRGLGRVVRVDREETRTGVAATLDRVAYSPDALESLT